MWNRTMYQFFAYSDSKKETLSHLIGLEGGRVTVRQKKKPEYSELVPYKVNKAAEKKPVDTQTLTMQTSFPEDVPDIFN